MFSFSASPRGCLFGGLPRNNTYRKREGRSKTTECAKTLYSCGYEEPCRWLPCGLGRYKVNGKMRLFHSFLGFLWVKHRFLPDFGPSGPLKPAFGAGLAGSRFDCLAPAASLLPAAKWETQSIRRVHFSPKRTLLFGARVAAIGVFSAPTTGAATLK